jgi:hypothetical protein
MRRIITVALKPLTPIRVITKPIYALYRRSPHFEHAGFVALAASEVFHLGPLIFAINVVLLVAGSAAIAYETFHLFGE